MIFDDLDTFRDVQFRLCSQTEVVHDEDHVASGIANTHASVVFWISLSAAASSACAFPLPMRYGFVELPALASKLATGKRFGVVESVKAASDVYMPIGGTIAAGAFAWDGPRGSGALDARWRDARLVAAGTVASLGTVDVAFVPQDGGLRGRVTNSGGDVRIDGTVTLAASGGTADVLATPQPGAPDAVARALAALGTPDGSGAVRISWRGGAR